MGTDIWRGVRGDLRRILLGVPGVLHDQIAYEGRPFTPVQDLAYIVERIDKGGARTATLGFAGMQEERGIYALDLNIPRKACFADGEDVADAIRCAFRPGRYIASPGADYAKGSILSSQVRTPIMLDTWTQFPVRIEFFFRRLTAQA